MATIKRFEDLEIWKMARQINVRVIPYLKMLTEIKDFGLKSQLDNAAGSVMDNIAEGFERDGNKEFIQFLAISKGSTGEVKSQLYRALDRGLIKKEEFDQFQKDCNLIGDKLGKFINYLNSSDIKGKKFTSTNKK